VQARISYLLVAMLVFTGLASAAADQKPVLLGEKVVTFRAERDEIIVGLGEGRFSKLLFEVEQNDQEMDRVSVSYGNGLVDTIPIRHVFK